MIKIRARVSDIEVEYEGDEAFLKEELLELLRSLSTLSTNIGQPVPMARPMTGGDTTITSTEHQLQGSINTVAAKLNVKTGTALVVATLAYSEFVLKKSRTTRAEITTEMKNATTFFKSSFLNNLSTYLGKLVKSQTINELSKDTYALSAKTRETLASKLTEK